VTGRLLLALGSVLALLLVEGVFRLFAPPPDWATALPPKPPGTYRVVVLGGSTAFGTPVRELGFAAQLEFLLRSLAPGRALEVVNLGRRGRPAETVRRAVDDVVERGDPDLLVVLTAHNEFLAAGDPSRLRRLARALRARLASVRVLADLLERPGRPDPMPERVTPVDREAPGFRDRLDRYRAELAAIADIAASRGVPLLISTGPSNLADWPPVHRAVGWAKADPDYDANVERVASLVAQGELAPAEAASRELLTRYGDDAMLLYLQGQALRQRGRPGEARDRLVRAKDLDPLPWRALEEQNDAIRALGARPGVEVVEADRIFARRSAGGLVGFELVADNVHPTPEGNALIADAIARVMARDGRFLDAATAIPDPEAALARYVDALGPENHRHLEHERLLETGIYAMKTPFYHYGISRRYLEAGLELEPGSWIAWANLGVLSLLEGDTPVGLDALRRAVRVRGGPLRPEDRTRVPYLEVALARSGSDLETLR